MSAAPYTAEEARERMASRETGRLYSEREIGLLDETTLAGVLALYQVRGEHDLAEEIELELEQREAEREHEADQDRKQVMHDEWLAATFG